MTAVVAEPESHARAESETASLPLAARFGGRFSVGQALREQHVNTLTWLKRDPPDAVLFARPTEEVAEIVKLCAEARVPVVPFGPAPRWKAMSTRRSAGSPSICRG